MKWNQKPWQEQITIAKWTTLKENGTFKMMHELSAKERMQIPRQAMPEQEPSLRSNNFEEVNLGYTRELALTEAQRCLQCKTPHCMKGCPVDIKIRDFIKLITEEKFLQAFSKIREDNFLPAICGRVCPQEKQCEASCILNKKSDPVAIGRLERFVADYVMRNEESPQAVPPLLTGKRVAIIGSGPASLACANDLATYGHDVTIFEALHKLGGVLVYGIPEFRLPKRIVEQEINGLKEKGVHFLTNAVIGKSDSISDLFENENFDAVFIGTGAGLPKFMNIKGEDLAGVYSSNEFLTRVNLMKAYLFPKFDSPVLDCRNKNVAIIGGGNTAMDAVRIAKRLGAKSAKIIYRRSEEEMPARLEEIHHAKAEGIEFFTLTNPLEYIGNENQKLQSMRLQKMQLGEPDASGRRKAIPIPESEYETSVDIVVIAIGNKSNPLIADTTPNLQTNSNGNISIDLETMQTSLEGVYAGGDIVTGGATVIQAMGAGRKAARSIHQFLTR